MLSAEESVTDVCLLTCLRVVRVACVQSER